MMTKELLERANALHNRSVALKNQLDELHKLEREPASFALCSRYTENGIVLNNLPQATLDAVVDLLIGAFAREIAKVSAEFAELGNEQMERSQSKWVAN